MTSFFLLVESSILSQQEIYQLGTWLNEASSFGEYQLCWKASTHGWRASVFHNKCDGKSDTITIFKVGTNAAFGGYTDVAWSC